MVWTYFFYSMNDFSIWYHAWHCEPVCVSRLSCEQAEAGKMTESQHSHQKKKRMLNYTQTSDVSSCMRTMTLWLCFESFRYCYSVRPVFSAIQDTLVSTLLSFGQCFHHVSQLLWSLVTNISMNSLDSELSYWLPRVERPGQWLIDISLSTMTSLLP